MRRRILIIIWVVLMAIHVLLAAIPIGWREPATGEALPCGEMESLMRQVDRLEQAMRSGEVDVELMDPLRAYLRVDEGFGDADREQRIRYLYGLTQFLEAVATESHSLRLRRCALLPGPHAQWPSLVIDGDGSAEAVQELLLDAGHNPGAWTLHDLQLLRVDGTHPWWFIGLMVVNEAALR